MRFELFPKLERESYMLWKKTAGNQNGIFVSIGAGINQVPLIREAKGIGLQIVGVDQSVNAAGISLCDIRIHESVENYQEIYNKLRELLLHGEIRGVLSKSFGVAVKTSSFLANKFNIPQISYKRIDDFIDKKRMKSVLNKNKIKTPTFRLFQKKDLLNKKMPAYPFVIKPAKGHAKKNVRLIRNEEDFTRYIKGIPSGNGSYLVEKFVEGDEIIAVGIVYKGQYYLADITDKIVEPPHFVDLMHISPSKYYHRWDDISKIGQSIAGCFEIYTYPLIMELIVAPDGDLYVIEASPEFGGEFLSDVLIPERTGYNVIRESINAVLDNNFSPPRKKKARSAAVVKYITGRNGTLVSFKPKQILKNNGVIFSRVFKDIGSRVYSPRNNHDRLGVIVARGKTREEAVLIAGNAEKGMRIRIRR